MTTELDSMIETSMTFTRRAGGFVATMTMVLAGGLVAASPASAATPVSVEINGITYEADSDDVSAGAFVTDYDRLGSSDSSTVTIPDEVTMGGDDYDVVEIDDLVFESEHIEELVIGDHVTTIGGSAFYLNDLETLSLGSSVETIGNGAFRANNLVDVVVPDSVVTIGDTAFHSNELETLSLGSAVTTIGDEAFRKGPNSPGNHLETLVVPDSVTMIGQNAFYGNDLDTLTLGGSVETIDGSAFAGNKLTDVVVPNSVVTIGFRAFERNSQLTHVTLGNSVATVSGRAFGQTDGPLVVEFTGEAPTVVEASNTMHSFENSDTEPLLRYPWRYGDPQTPGGYTSPTWEGYDAQAIATVDFDLNGHGTTTPDDQSVVVGENATAPATEPTASGYEFVGWFTGAGADVEFDFSDAIQGDVTVYAGGTPSKLQATATTATPTAPMSAMGPQTMVPAPMVVSLMQTRSCPTPVVHRWACS